MINFFCHLYKEEYSWLATLLEGAGYTSKIFECEFQILFLLWSTEAVKLINGVNDVLPSLSFFNLLTHTALSILPSKYQSQMTNPQFF